jgi:hypothetical protein
MDIISRVVARYAKRLNRAEFDKLMQWIGPKAYAVHKDFPRGLRKFDTETRVFKFNIDPEDFLAISIDEAIPLLQEGTPISEIANPKAYRAMKELLGALKKRRIRYKIVKMRWREGGSYIQAELPKPKVPKPPPPGSVDPRTWI